MRFVDVSLNSRSTVLFLMVALIVTGVFSYLTLPREKYPDIKIPILFVSTEYPGAAPTEVEQQLTHPLERELAGLTGVKKMTSKSMESVSLVSVEFVSGTDVDVALQRVRDRVELAKVDFPDDAEEPILKEVSFSDVPIVQVNLSGDVGPVVLKQIAEDLQDEFETVGGVLSATLVGGLEREVQVDVDPRRLALYDLALDDVKTAIEDENVSIPGGDLDLGPLTYAVRIPGEVEDPKEIGDFVITSRGGKPIFIRDVAEVRFGFEDRSSYARVDGRESVALTIQKRVGANVIQVVDDVKATVDRMSREWPAGLRVDYLGDASKEIHLQVKDLENSILSGLFLVLLVLMFALGLRNAVFVALAIPFSLLLTFVTLQMAGVTLNMVVLFSLVLAVGMLVDNAVVVIENIYRHMQEGTPRLEAALRATHEVDSAILVSTLTTVGAFSPLFVWPGLIGDFMSYLPLTVCIALVSSLVVAFTINPVLCSIFMRATPPSGGETQGAIRSRLTRWGGRISEAYGRLLAWSLDHRGLTLAGTLVVFLIGCGLFAAFNNGTELISEEKPKQIKVDIDLPPGSQIERTNEITSKLEAKLSQLPDLRVMAASVGSGSQSDDFGDAGSSPNAARIILDLVDREFWTQDSNETLLMARKIAGTLPGVDLDVDKMTDDLPVGPPVSFELSGEDFAVLGRISQRIRKEIEDIPGLFSLKDDFDLARPEVVVDVDRVEASRLGLTMANIAGTIRTAVHGTEASTYRQGDEAIDVTVRLAGPYRQSLDDLAGLRIVGDSGAAVPLGSIAKISRTSALPAINHKDRRRVVTISGQVTQANLAEPIRAEAERRLATLPDLLPTGYSMQQAGQQEEEVESRQFLLGAFTWAVIIVLALMVGKFDSVAIPMIIISSVLMSMFGVFVGLLVTRLPFSIVLTGVGVISLAGIVVNNAIVLLDYAEKLRAQGMARRQTLITTGSRRLRPVLLTAVTTILGLLPLTTGIEFDFHAMALSTDSESSDYWRSMGVAVIFGLAFATFLTLVLVPVMYDLLWGLRDRWNARYRPNGHSQGGDSSDDPVDRERPVLAEGPLPDESHR